MFFHCQGSESWQVAGERLPPTHLKFCHVNKAEVSCRLKNPIYNMHVSYFSSEGHISNCNSTR